MQAFTKGGGENLKDDSEVEYFLNMLRYWRLRSEWQIKE